ncbi:MFS transporter, DHA1 family, multidrug resistance protein [Paenibacillus uliginis N3/975]|uniref:MFS transporter, DHA1 family, multidrug resistance protein n=1 Tax=Paenibacillus uliginis N3/975 TaxID=1313296 RepID=A0A1X7HG55_9BACL|nr:MFS transporter [Paenibacillus uliginis]SMF84989.1 MFS transporter, DHA1 family, multidrug resistance protein [Paenibacillus uliginis N3/975]
MRIFTREKISLIVILINLFIAFVGVGLAAPIMPSLAKEMHLSGQVMGYMISAFAFAMFLVSPIAGIWVDTIGRKKMIVLGLFLFSFSELLFATGNQVWVLFLSRILGGIGDALIMPAVTAFIADSTSLEERAKVMGYQAAAISLGFIIGPGLGGFIAELGIRAPFFFAAGFALVTAIISLLVLQEPLTKDQLAKNRKSKMKVSFFLEIKKSFHPLYLVPLIIVFVLSFGLSAYEMMFSLFVDSKFGFTAKDIATIITVGSISGVVAQLLFFDKLVNKSGEKKLIHYMIIVAAIFIVASVFVSRYWSIMAVSSIVFFACDLLRPAVTTLLSKLAGEEQGFVAGMNSMYTSLGIIIGPALGGILFDVNINLPYIFAAVVLFSAFVISVVWKSKAMESIS